MKTHTKDWKLVNFTLNSLLFTFKCEVILPILLFIQGGKSVLVSFLGESPIDPPSSMPSASLASSIYFSQLASSSQPKHWTPILTWHHPRLLRFLIPLAFSGLWIMIVPQFCVFIQGHHGYFPKFNFLIAPQHFKNPTTSLAFLLLESSLKSLFSYNITPMHYYCNGPCVHVI